MSAARLQIQIDHGTPTSSTQVQSPAGDRRPFKCYAVGVKPHEGKAGSRSVGEHSWLNFSLITTNSVITTRPLIKRVVAVTKQSNSAVDSASRSFATSTILEDTNLSNIKIRTYAKRVKIVLQVKGQHMRRTVPKARISEAHEHPEHDGGQGRQTVTVRVRSTRLESSIGS